ncbi:MAG: M48 family metallopeptidase [Deltaproteobacteria bacterium]|nr:M48 family metallopeptidase [Deltaproteobacteria bacterium]
MRKTGVKYLLAAAAAILVLAACATVPLTGRHQLALVPNDTILATSLTQYDDFLKKHKLSPNMAEAAMVKRVGTRIAGAVRNYLVKNGLADRANDFNWEFNLVEDNTANAWCMPGGKVVVYTGILPITKTETGLAVVMAHEIGHAVARHGNERMSQGLMAQLGGMALSTALDTKPETTRQLWTAAYGLSAQLGFLLPYSRVQESEADRLGLMFMAMAGYDPREAVAFWTRMEKNKSGKGSPEFFSTHPSDARRIRDIQKFIPQALPYFNGKKLLLTTP